MKPKHKRKRRKLKTKVRLVRGSLIKNCCKDKSSGHLCGSVYEQITTDSSGHIVKLVCYPAGHSRVNEQQKGRLAA